jgi:hypothetical protein
LEINNILITVNYSFLRGEILGGNFILIRGVETLLKVYPCGTDVTLSNINILGKITAILIRDSFISYEVGYFLKDNYCRTIFSESELIYSTATKRNIGFN